MVLSDIISNHNDHPFIIEQIAIDTTNALSSASISIRGFRERPLLHHLWDNLTGKDLKMRSAIDSDILTVQKSTINLIREVMSGEMRTQYCIDRVIRNLKDVNEDLDALTRQVYMLEEVVKGLSVRQKALEYKVRLETFYRAGTLHPGTGLLLGSALYVAQINRTFANLDDIVSDENKVAMTLVNSYLDDDKPEVTSVLLSQLVNQINEDMLETAAFLTTDRHGAVLRVIGMLVERRAVGLQIDAKIAQEALQIVRRFRDPEGDLRKHLMRPSHIVSCISNELLHEF